MNTYHQTNLIPNAMANLMYADTGNTEVYRTRIEECKVILSGLSKDKQLEFYDVIERIFDLCIHSGVSRKETITLAHSLSFIQGILIYKSSRVQDDLKIKK